MAYKQLVSPNPNQTGKSLFCLKFVGDAYSIKNRPYAYATEAWDATKFKHKDHNLPNASVPVWFTWWGTIDGTYRNWGDVAIWIPGKGVVGSPLRNQKGQHVCASVAERAEAIGGGAKYLGWSEDIDDVRVVINEGDEVANAIEVLQSALNKARKDAYVYQSALNVERKENAHLKKENAGLKAQIGDTSEFNALGKALATLLKTLGYKKS